MEKMWGSSCSLGGLLAESLLCDGGDNFLEDLPNFPDAKAGDFMPVLGASSGTNSVDSTVSADAGLGAPDAISALLTSGCTPASLPSLASTAMHPMSAAFSQDWPTDVQPNLKVKRTANNPNTAVTAANLALLQQLLGGIQTGAITLPPPPPPPPAAQVAANLLSQLAALKPAAPVAKTVFAPVSNAGPSAAVVPENTTAPAALPVSVPLSLPGLNEQQQEALRSLVALGQLGANSEGKKVRRMLSNRESARRSRHRKQAHMQTLEQKSTQLDAENAQMKEALARAAAQELNAVEERTRLYAEIAQLREKCARLEASAANSKASSKDSELSTKKGLSNSSSAGGCSDDSCDSLPNKRRIPCDSDDTGDCKRCRRSVAKCN